MAGVLVVLVALAIYVYRQSRSDIYIPMPGDAPREESARPRALSAPRLALRPFDPNTADSTTLLGLGLAEWQVRAIYHYRAKGGVYMRPDDFARLPGLTVKKFRQLRPYIRIAEDFRPAAEVYARRQLHYDTPSPSPVVYDSLHPRKLGSTESILLNHADTLQLRRVPGIGPAFARRIARYREQLGGFVSTAQLLEIDDFPESALPFFHIQAGEPVRRLNINRATNEQLRKHPYITYQMARQVIAYRRLHGTIHDVDELRLIATFTDTVRRQLRPYLEY